MLTKLSVLNNDYHVNCVKVFMPRMQLLKEDIVSSFIFAFEMSFGTQGEHRKHRSGGTHFRKNGQLFINAFQGKLVEFGLYRYFKKHGIECSVPDIETYALGKWDSCDIVACGKLINVKSTKYFGNLLLLETKDWNNSGQYIPNLEIKSHVNYDFFVLLRLKPDGEKLMKFHRLYYENNIDKNKLEEIILSQKWEYDLPGFISNEVFVKAINNEMIIPKNSFLNGRAKMDAENYYIQTGDMIEIHDLINILNKKQ